MGNPQSSFAFGYAVTSLQPAIRNLQPATRNVILRSRRCCPGLFGRVAVVLVHGLVDAEAEGGFDGVGGALDDRGHALSF